MLQADLIQRMIKVGWASGSEQRKKPNGGWEMKVHWTPHGRDVMIHFDAIVGLLETSGRLTQMQLGLLRGYAIIEARQPPEPPPPPKSPQRLS